MNQEVSVTLQGLSANRKVATGIYDPIEAGKMDREKLTSLLRHVIQIPLLEEKEGQDLCPPHIIIEGEQGMFTFASNNGSYWCNEIQTELNSDQAAALAFGDKKAEDFGGKDVRIPQSDQIPTAPRMRKKRRNAGCGFICFVVLAIVLLGIIGQIGMYVSDDPDAAPESLLTLGIISLILFFVGRFFMAFKKVPANQSGVASKGDPNEVFYQTMVNHDLYDDSSDDGDID